MCQDGCGFCLEDSSYALWKCQRCSWKGHPTCWLQLRKECWNRKNIIRHSPGTLNQNMWDCPTGQCPQCRLKFSWLQFLHYQRQEGNMPPANICWGCNQQIDETKEKDTWKCSKGHAPREVHWNCLWKMCGWGFVKPECIECGSVPVVWSFRLRKLIEWQHEIPVVKMQSTTNTGDWYRVFFQTNSYGEPSIAGVLHCWRIYLKFIRQTVMIDPQEWWKTFHWSTYFVYEQLQRMLKYETMQQDNMSLGRIAPELLKESLEYFDQLYKAKAIIEGNNPLIPAVRKFYQLSPNRVSVPIPEEYFPESWLTFCIPQQSG